MVLFHLPRDGGQVDHSNEHMIDFHWSKSRLEAAEQRCQP